MTSCPKMEIVRNSTHGPWGYLTGEQWIFTPDCSIISITIHHGKIVDSLKFCTSTSKCRVGNKRSSSFTDGYLKDKIYIDSPAEYLVSISGRYDRVFDKGSIVKSLCFKTNKKNYGPYASAHDSKGRPFSYNCKDDEELVGFHGYVLRHMTALGVYVRPKVLALDQSSKICEDQSCSSMLEMVMPREPGPWGAGGGKPWDDGVFSTIKKVHIHLGELNVIYALHFEYLKRDGKSVMSRTHGATNGTKIEQVILDVKDDEYLIGVSGCYGPVDGREAIVSITFHTNKRICGPFGQEGAAGCVPYSSYPSAGKVVGFHGRNDGFLAAVGLHMEYFWR